MSPPRKNFSTLSVRHHDVPAGRLTRKEDGTFIFTYLREFLDRDKSRTIGPGFPLTAEEFSANELFPLFSNLLPEGENRAWVCAQLRISDDDDDFLLLGLIGGETTGAMSFFPEFD